MLFDDWCSDVSIFDTSNCCSFFSFRVVGQFHSFRLDVVPLISFLTSIFEIIFDPGRCRRIRCPINSVVFGDDSGVFRVRFGLGYPFLLTNICQWFVLRSFKCRSHIYRP